MGEQRGIAAEQARQAAERAGVVITDVTTGEQADAVAALFDTIWGVSVAGAVLPAEVLRMYRLTGQFLAMAHDARTGALVAASNGILAAPPGQALHSHVTGTLPQARDRSVGLALKLHQRAWALDRGLRTITWTFDPLLRRNAWFNLVKLGAGCADYLVEFYGSMPDAVNAGDLSDRMYLHWDLTRPVGGPPPPDRAPERMLLAAGADGGPGPVRTDLLQAAPPSAAAPLGVALPQDAETLRRTDPRVALAWRLAVREALTGARAAGYRPTTMSRDGCYVLAPEEER